MSRHVRDSARKRWVVAALASIALHASLLLWWRGIDLAPGTGPAGGREGDGGNSSGLAAGSVIEVQIDVDAPVPAGTTVPADEIAVSSDRTSVPPTSTRDADPPTADTTDVSIGTSERGQGGESGAGARSGTGTGDGSDGPAEGLGVGDGGTPGGVGVRTGVGAAGDRGGTVPPRPIEITWPDTRKLSHCVGLRIDVRIRVDAAGRVERVESASPGLPADCVASALETARRIKFAPGTVGGKPTALWSVVTIDFEKKK